MLKTIWKFLVDLNTMRPSNYPTETATITCNCGFHSELSIETVERSFGNRPLSEIEDELKQQCCKRSGTTICSLSFYEASVPSFYR